MITDRGSSRKWTSLSVRTRVRPPGGPRADGHLNVARAPRAPSDGQGAHIVQAHKACQLGKIDADRVRRHVATAAAAAGQVLVLVVLSSSTRIPPPPRPLPRPTRRGGERRRSSPQCTTPRFQASTLAGWQPSFMMGKHVWGREPSGATIRQAGWEWAAGRCARVTTGVRPCHS